MSMTSGKSRMSGEHRDVYPLFPSAGGGLLVASVNVSHDAGTRVVGEHAGEAFGGSWSAIGDDDLAGMDRVADADAAAMVEGDPSSAGGCVEQGVEQWPVGNGIAT